MFFLESSKKYFCFIYVLFLWKVKNVIQERQVAPRENHQVLSWKLQSEPQ